MRVSDTKRMNRLIKKTALGPLEPGVEGTMLHKLLNIIDNTHRRRKRNNLAIGRLLVRSRLFLTKSP